MGQKLIPTINIANVQKMDSMNKIPMEEYLYKNPKRSKLVNLKLQTVKGIMAMVELTKFWGYEKRSPEISIPDHFLVMLGNT